MALQCFLPSVLPSARPVVGHTDWFVSIFWNTFSTYRISGTWIPWRCTSPGYADPGPGLLRGVLLPAHLLTRVYQASANSHPTPSRVSSGPTQQRACSQPLCAAPFCPPLLFPPSSVVVPHLHLGARVLSSLSSSGDLILFRSSPFFSRRGHQGCLLASW